MVEAYDSGHVLQLVMRREFDALVLPERAEPIDGEDLLPVIRRITSAVIIVAGPGEQTAMARALLSGADAYLQYPDEIENVRSRLRAALRPRRIRRPADRANGAQLNGSN